jgi:hypothetical protein
MISSFVLDICILFYNNYSARQHFFFKFQSAVNDKSLALKCLDKLKFQNSNGYTVGIDRLVYAHFDHQYYITLINNYFVKLKIIQRVQSITINCASVKSLNPSHILLGINKGWLPFTSLFIKYIHLNAGHQ